MLVNTYCHVKTKKIFKRNRSLGAVKVKDHLKLTGTWRKKLAQNNVWGCLISIDEIFFMFLIIFIK